MVKSNFVYKNFNIKQRHKNSIILIGNFDGVHIGHRKLFELAKKYKKKFKLKIGVLTFEPMPKMFFNKKIKNFRISNLDQKYQLLKKLSVDFIINKKFDKRFSKIKSLDFIKNVIHKKLKAKFVFVSNNFKYGNKREGNVSQLINFEKKYDYKIIKSEPKKIKKKVISSSLIRNFLRKGNLEKANKYLKRNWSIIGKVEKGRKLGKKIGFPTCNLDIKEYVLATPGVYAVKAARQNSNTWIKGIANLGYRPTFNQKKLLLEVHLFNFSGNLYNKYLTVEFLKFIRKEKKFKNVEQLKKQIKSDLLIAKKA
ncbi:bifunctional riboflavin kinase/FAD synthetase [Pelagibacterales bacterium SAG-MED30]|nr:bifunctional riboflavin kinase/FAD synthetase [Pelagibacterales bacterium SAG-MED30]|tara:strand:+ start:1116 stop:2045 length:930 start_codon:yes stop_codon:yes gene_type:complete